MSETAQKPAAEQQPVIDRAFLDANHGALLDEVRTEATTKERERILAIQGLQGPADLKAELVKDSTVSAGDAALRILAARSAADAAAGNAHLKERAAAEEDLDAPEPSADAQGSATEERRRAKRIVAIHKQFTGRGTAAPA